MVICVLIIIVLDLHSASFLIGSMKWWLAINFLSSFPAATGTPGGLTSTSMESRSLSLVWETVPCPLQGGPITGYRLRRHSNGTSIVNTTGEGNRQYVLTGLTPFTSYSVQVAAVNDGGTGPYSTPLTVETLAGW